MLRVLIPFKTRNYYWITLIGHFFCLSHLIPRHLLSIYYIPGLTGTLGKHRYRKSTTTALKDTQSSGKADKQTVSRDECEGKCVQRWSNGPVVLKGFGRMSHWNDRGPGGLVEKRQSSGTHVQIKGGNAREGPLRGCRESRVLGCSVGEAAWTGQGWIMMTLFIKGTSSTLQTTGKKCRQ